MKGIKNVVISIICAGLCLFACGCVNDDYQRRINIVVEDGDYYYAQQNVITTTPNSNVTFTFVIDSRYAFSDCNYEGWYLKEQRDNSVTVVLPNVKYSTRIKITLDKKLIVYDENNLPEQEQGTIRYYLNGGNFLDNDQGICFEDTINVEHHLRHNTNIGTNIIYRDGYTQIGWNTQADCKGEHIGLGSRITVPESNMINLYAEWAKWTDEDLFKFKSDESTEEPNDVTLTEYMGELQAENLVIPAYIGGKKVSSINKGFTDGLNINSLILPNTLNSIQENAFTSTEINEIYIFDNIVEVTDSSFGRKTGIKTVHINAVESPCYTQASDNAWFAEAMDRLILNREKKKMIFFGGCSMGYGLNSPMVEEAFNGEYFICNVGVVGSTNAHFQLDCIANYVDEGDIFIHAPETMSAYQLLHDVEAEAKMFIMVEANYDLLAIADCSKIVSFFDTFSNYNKGRNGTKKCAYTDYNSHYNEYGDMNIERPNSLGGVSFGMSPLFATNYLSETAINNLNIYYGKIKNKGATVFVSFGPVNEAALGPEIANKQWEVFNQILLNGLNDQFRIISKTEDYIFSSIYFYDSDYHLSSEGAKIRTERLISDIKTALNN